MSWLHNLAALGFILLPLILIFGLPLYDVLRYSWRLAKSKYVKFLFIFAWLSPFLLLVSLYIDQIGIQDNTCPIIHVTFWSQISQWFSEKILSSLVVGTTFLIPLLIILSVVHLFWASSPERKMLLWAMYTMFIGGFFISFAFLDVQSPGPRAYDARRIASVRQVQLALELYADANDQKYPLVDGSNAVERWRSLGSFLTPQYIDQFPSDPCFEKNKDNEYQFDFKSSDTGGSYVVRALLSGKNNNVFNDDADGEIFGIWCGEQGNENEYCVQP